MKKKFLIISILFLATFKLIAQNSNWDFNIYYRYQKTSFDDESFNGYNEINEINTFRGAIGTNFSFPIKNNVGILVGLNVSNNGQIYENKDNELFRYYKATYLKIPFLINFSHPKNETKRLYLKFGIGPQLSFLLGSKVLESDDKDFSNAAEIKLPIEFKNTVIDICIKLGLDIRISNKSYIYLGLNLDGSISDPLEKSGWMYSINGNGDSGEFGSHYSTLGFEFGINWNINR